MRSVFFLDNDGHLYEGNGTGFTRVSQKAKDSNLQCTLCRQVFGWDDKVTACPNSVTGSHTLVTI